MTRIASIVVAFTLFMAVLAAPLQQALNQESRLWSLCDDPSTHLLKAYEDGVSINPSGPRVGEDLDVVIRGVLDSDVTGGSINLDLKLMGIIKLQKNLDLCSTLNSEVMAGGTTCPMDAGDVMIRAHAFIPKETPRVPVAGDIRIVNQDGETITCVRINLKLH
jgi:hypothetical protein